MPVGAWAHNQTEILMAIDNKPVIPPVLDTLRSLGFAVRLVDGIPGPRPDSLPDAT